jgi:hypothetical protein
MKRFLVAACALTLFAGCGQQEAATPEAPAAPQSLMEQVAAMAPEQQPVFAWQQLTAWQTAHPEAQPPCASIRRVDAVGVIPDNVDPESLYAGYKGAMVFAVQCGPQLTTVRDDPREQWLVAFAPGAAEAAVISCVAEGGRSDCPRVPRLAEAAAAP